MAQFSDEGLGHGGLEPVPEAGCAAEQEGLRCTLHPGSQNSQDTDEDRRAEASPPPQGNAWIVRASARGTGPQEEHDADQYSQGSEPLLWPDLLFGEPDP